MKKRSAPVDRPPILELRGPAATIRLCRPKQHNRIDPDDIGVLREALRRIESSAGTRALVITGTGSKTFSSGFTVDAIVERLDRSFEVLLDAVERFPLPTICALNGSVYGGATDLALCCDFRIGVRGTRMFMPAARFGLHYYPGGLRRYVQAVGLTQAKRLFLTAQPISSEEMLRIGFLTELVERRELAGKIADYVTALAECEPGVVRSMKLQLNAIAGGERSATRSRSAYEASLRSAELRARLGALARRRR